VIPPGLFAVVFGALEIAGGVQELVYRGILSSETEPLIIGTLGTVAKVLLLAAPRWCVGGAGGARSAFLFWHGVGVFHFAVALSKPCANFLRIILEGAIATLVGDAAAFVNDIEPLGPCGIRVVGAVGHFIDAKGYGKFIALDEIVADGDAIFDLLGLGVADVVFFLFVGLHPPLVGRMRFTDVNGEKVNVILVIVIDLDDVANLATERRSSKAAEDEDERAARGPFANVKAGGAVERNQTSIRSLIADLQIATVHVGQGVAHHVKGVLWAAGHDAEHHVNGGEKNCQADQNPFNG